MPSPSFAPTRPAAGPTVERDRLDPVLVALIVSARIEPERRDRPSSRQLAPIDVETSRVAPDRGVGGTAKGSRPGTYDDVVRMVRRLLPSDRWWSWPARFVQQARPRCQRNRAYLTRRSPWSTDRDCDRPAEHDRRHLRARPPPPASTTATTWSTPRSAPTPAAPNAFSGHPPHISTRTPCTSTSLSSACRFTAASPHRRNASSLYRLHAVLLRRYHPLVHPNPLLYTSRQPRQESLDREQSRFGYSQLPQFSAPIEREAKLEHQCQRCAISSPTAFPGSANRQKETSYHLHRHPQYRRP